VTDQNNAADGGAAAGSQPELPQGWSQSADNPMGVLAVLKLLRLWDGFVLWANQL